jgi:hypothetical protein
MLYSSFSLSLSLVNVFKYTHRHTHNTHVFRYLLYAAAYRYYIYQFDDDDDEVGGPTALKIESSRWSVPRRMVSLATHTRNCAASHSPLQKRIDGYRL